MDVAGWLRGVGLGQYEANFRDNKIDADMLPRLTGDDLKDIGVSALGDRLRLLDAIAALTGAKLLADVAVSSSNSAPLKSSQVSAERRPITVMFCDLVGSTALASRLDAEDWRSLVNAYLDEASGAVNRLGGHVLKRLGDGLMALFGYPHAQENDAERAVRAALAIQLALSEINARNAAKGAPQLSARIGLESGPVVVEAAGEVFGDAPNVAARVQGLAEPGSVLITMNVQRQVAGLFVAEEQGARELKGVSEPVQLFRIVRASGGGRRGGARALTPFVGREEELSLLLRRWERARAGEGQLVLIVGEPGLGKSRLIEEFHGQLAETPHTWSEWSASQLLQNTPLHPFVEWGRQRFGGVDVPADKRFAELEIALRQVKLDADEAAPLLAALLDIPLPPGQAAELASEELRRRQLVSIVSWVLASARTQPIVLAFEDLHWADPTTIEVFRALAERGAQAPLLLIATTRPEFRPPWGMRPHHSAISLAPLDRAQVQRMVGEIASRHALSKDVVEGVGERTGGVPLFVEEVTRLLLERGEQGAAQAIPPTLQQSLAARLDRLGPARETAQIGAVLGRDFSYALLRSVTVVDASELDRRGGAALNERAYSEPGLQSALDRLAEADILIAEGAGAQATYRFKHALIQDAAYESLLKSRRQALHRRAAEILRDESERAAAEPELIAHHFTEAGLDDLAIEWWGKAGDQALRRSAFQEAIAHLSKAIAMADKSGGAKGAAVGRPASIQSKIGQALLWSKGFAAEESRRAFARVEEIGGSAPNADERFAAYYGQWVNSFIRSQLVSAGATAEEFLRRAEGENDEAAAAAVRRHLGTTRLYEGKVDEARELLTAAVDSLDNTNRNVSRPFEPYERIASMANLAFANWHRGDVGVAAAQIRRALADAMGHGEPPARAYARMFESMIECRRDDPARTVAAADALMNVARQYGMSYYHSLGQAFFSWARARLDQGNGVEDVRRALASYLEAGNKCVGAWLHGLLAEIEALSNGFNNALSAIERGLVIAEETGEHFSDSCLHRLRGDILLKRDPANPAPAEEAFRTAIAIAHEQAARSFELRAALALAKLYQSTARPADAHAVLAPALEGFSPTPEMPEIAEAQVLLAALAETGEVKAAVAQRERRVKLQTAYGQALLWSKGFVAEDAKAAFARAADLAGTTEDAAARFAVYTAQWLQDFVRGEFARAREAAGACLRQAEAEGDVGGTRLARLMLGLILLFQGDLIAARLMLERDAVLKPDEAAQLSFGIDTEVRAQAYLALTDWHLGDIDRARELIDQALLRAQKLDQPATIATALHWKTILELRGGDAPATAACADALLKLIEEHGIKQYVAVGRIYSNWARGRLLDAQSGVIGLRQALAAYFDEGNRAGATSLHGLLAELEAETRGAEIALTLTDQGLAIANETGEHFADPYLDRLRGDLLLKRDPADPAPAEDAYRTAVIIAKQQGARSYELLASLSLAKLYQSTARPADAYAVLAPALEAFSPTPEMPEIAEAQALLAALAETGEVKAEATQRRRMTHLQVAYGHALIATRGYGAPETTEAFTAARESTHGDSAAPGRLAADYGLWVGSYVRGELAATRAHAAAFRRDVEARPDSPAIGVAHRVLGATHCFAGEYVEAREHLERALALFEPTRDDDLAFRFGQDAGVAAMFYLAFTLWPLGDVERAVSLVDAAQARIAGLPHVQTRAYGKSQGAMFELMRGDLSRVARNTAELAAELAQLAREHDLPLWRAFGVFLQGLARAESDAPGGGLEDMRRGIDLLREQNVVLFDGMLKIALAKAEARAGDVDRAVAVIDEALATCERIGYRAFEAELHRVRGETLLKRGQVNSAPAEEALQTALAVAKQQGTRSFGLRAALALARLNQLATAG